MKKTVESSETTRETKLCVENSNQPGSWGAAFLAGLPHLIMGLLTGAG